MIIIILILSLVTAFCFVVVWINAVKLFFENITNNKEGIGLPAYFNSNQTQKSILLSKRIKKWLFLFVLFLSVTVLMVSLFPID